MALSVRHDETYPGGGHAVLEGDGLDGVTAISIESTYSGMYLDRDGTWGKVRTVLPVAAVPGKAGTLSLGPRIVDAIATDTLLVLRGADGAEIGRLFWTGVIPTRGGVVHERAPILAPASAPALPPEPEPSSEPKPPPSAAPSLSEPPPDERPPIQDEGPAPTQEGAQEKGAAPTQEENAPPAREEDSPPAQEDSPPAQEEHPTPASRPKRVSTPISRTRRFWGLAAIGLVVILGFSLERHKPPAHARSDDIPGIVPRNGQEPSFTCRDDMSEPIAKLICADADLADADHELDQTYHQWLKVGPRTQRSRRILEKSWIDSRNRLCGIPASGQYDLRELAPYKACLLKLITDRNDALQR